MLLKKAVRISFFVWLVVMVGCFFVFNALCAFGWTIGSFISFATIFTYRRFAPRLLKSKDRNDAKRFFLRMYLAYLSFVLVSLFISVIFWGKNFLFVCALCCGIILVQSIIIFITIGSLLRKKADIGGK